MNDKKPEYPVINATFDAIAPLIKANGNDRSSVERFIFYLMIIAAAMADELDMDADTFNYISAQAWEEGKSKRNDKSAN